MTVIDIQQRRQGLTTIVTATSDGAGIGPRLWFHWYQDGIWIGRTETGVRRFPLLEGSEYEIQVVDTTDPDFDPIANAPEGFPSRLTVEFVRSTNPEVVRYEVEFDSFAIYPTQKIIVDATDDRWLYTVTSYPLGVGIEIAEFVFMRIRSFDIDGNPVSSPVNVLPTLKHVTRPEAPDFGISFDEGSGLVTFTEAA